MTAKPHDDGAAPASRPASSYDAVPYSVGAFPQTRPDRLATIASLFGMNPAPPARCRVLELGCAAGGNVIPMALADPDSEFVGIDLSERQIADARSTAAALGVRNLDLRAMSILDAGADLGVFDYVLSHGVYSWVPPEVQDKILRICSDNLSPQGVAYVSYNCYPGWHARGAIREMLWYHTERFEDPLVRIRAARGLLAFLVKFAPDDGGYGKLVRQELALLLATPDTYLLHEHLEEYNEPLYFHQFIGRAANHGLQYLGEAYVGAMLAGRFGPEGEAILRQISPDLLHMEQYMDFLRNRMFRQTLICHAGAALDYSLRPEPVTRFFVASEATPVAAPPGAAGDGSETFRAPGSATLSTADPLMKAAMHCLAEAYPVPMPFDDLVVAASARSPGAAGDASALAARLLNCYLSNLVEFSASPPRFVGRVSERPIASAYARHRAREEGGKVVNVRLESVQLSAPARLVLQHLDGRHDRAALVAMVARWLESADAKGLANALSIPGAGAKDDAAAAAGPPPDPKLPPPDPKLPSEVRAAAYVEALLQGFARGALLVQ